ASSTGAETSSVNVWTFSASGGPSVDGSNLDFAASTSPWTACSRTNTVPAPSIGVSIVYRYRFTTPLGSLFGMLGGANSGLDITDKAVMARNPTQ
ncbi:MAG: hypothetical protein WCK58_17780, partial [Chloroflexota bacterium]